MAKNIPSFKLDISSASHPFFTGKMKMIDATGRVDRFNKKYGNFRKTPKTEDAEATAEK